MATFCLLHGAWHDGSSWQALVRSLNAGGHDAVAPDLPFDDPSTGYEERVHPALEALEGAADPVVIVGHSMGSAYAPIVASARPSSLVVHLCPGLGPLRDGFPWPPNGPDGTCAWDAETAMNAMYRRLPAETARALTERLRPMASAAGRPPRLAPLDIPRVVIYGSEDELFDPASERSKAQALCI